MKTGRFTSRVVFRFAVFFWLTLASGCAGLSKVKKAFTPYRPSQQCTERYASKTWGWCGPNVRRTIEGNSVVIRKDYTLGSRSAWKSLDWDVPAHCCR